MSTSAEVILIGNYEPEISDCLDYPVDHYATVPTGTVVIAHYLQTEGRRRSEQLVASLGVIMGDPATYPVKKKNIQWDKLADDYDANDVGQLRRLVGAGFAMIFVPDF